MELAERSKESYNINSGYTSTNIIKDLPLIYIHF